MRGLWVSYGTHTGRTEKPSVRLERPVPIEYSRSTEPAFEAIGQLNDNLRKERCIFIGAIIFIAIFAVFVAYKGSQIADKSEKMTQWYEDNNEAVLFGRYLRVNENDRWRFWHDKWVNDPGLKENMNDYFQMEEWKEKKRKNSIYTTISAHHTQSTTPILSLF